MNPDPGAGDERVSGAIRGLISAGDRDAAAALAIERYGREVHGRLRALLHDDDAATEAFLRFAEHLWTGRASFRAESSFRTWIFRIARNAASDVRKDAWRQRACPLTAAAADELLEPARDDDGLLAEVRHALDRLRPYLSRDERALLALRVEHELSWAEIARHPAFAHERLGPTTMSKRFARLSARLRRMALQHGLTR